MNPRICNKITNNQVSNSSISISLVISLPIYPVPWTIWASQKCSSPTPSLLSALTAETAFSSGSLQQGHTGCLSLLSICLKAITVKPLADQVWHHISCNIQWDYIYLFSNCISFSPLPTRKMTKNKMINLYMSFPGIII